MYKYAEEIREANEQRRKWNEKLAQLCCSNGCYEDSVFEYVQDYVRNAKRPVSISELVRETGLNRQVFSLGSDVFPGWAGFVPDVVLVTQHFTETDETGSPFPNVQTFTVTKKRRVWRYDKKRDRS